MNLIKLWQNLVETYKLYRIYKIGKIYKFYTFFGIRNSIRLLKLYLNKENNA